MKTKIRRNKDIFFIDLEGILDLSGVDSLSSFCFSNLKKKKIVFNLTSLNFVGSIGVDVFSKTLENVDKQNQLKVCCASSEFEKILNNEGLSVYRTEEEAISAF